MATQRTDEAGRNRADAAASSAPIHFIVEVLRGQAQVDFMPSALCGVFFTVALFVSGWRYGFYGLLGTALATGTAIALGVDRDRVTAGLEGFNGCLVAVGFAVFLGADHASTWLLAAAGAITVTVVTAALDQVLSTWNIPTFTAPFCIIATVMIVAAPGFRRVWHSDKNLAAFPGVATGKTALNWHDTWHAFLGNVGQIFFMPQWYVGLLFLLGIFAASRLAGAMACLGSAVGILVAWTLGSPADSVAQGLMGYNAVLVAMALCGVFIKVSGWSVAYAVLGAAVATVLTTGLGNFTSTFGGHAFTWPFVLTALAFVAAVPSFPRLRRT
ncbi:urea transporter [Catenulispora pinisilvae]|uniref:urea transporter n=1 Tax=Catenulispora pinisilvae TaxID=2705253 RepID=UPI001891BD70|nr:urea transporter [Catenulispora pinisilvae]